MRYQLLGLMVFALGPGGYPHKNCDGCSDGQCINGDPVFCRCLACHGFYRATLDPAVLEAQFVERPWSILGIRAGAASRVLVLDFDSHGGVDGREQFAAWAAEGKLPESWTVLTGGGGLHVYYSIRQAVPTKLGFRPAVDLKADGGYVVAPGVAKRGKNPYVEVPGRELLGSPAPAPAWLLHEVFDRRPSRVGSLIKQVPWTPFSLGRSPAHAYESALEFQAAGNGSRNHAVYVVASRVPAVVAAALVTEEAAEAACWALAEAAGLTGAQFAKQWKSGFREGERRLADPIVPPLRRA